MKFSIYFLNHKVFLPVFNFYPQKRHQKSDVASPVGGFNPSKKYARQIGSFPPILEVNIKNI